MECLCLSIKAKVTLLASSGKNVIPLGLEIRRFVHSFVSRNQCQLDISGYILPIYSYVLLCDRIGLQKGGGVKHLS